MKQRILSLLAFVTLIIGLSLLLYPSVSNYFRTWQQRRAIYRCVSSIADISNDDYTAYLESAMAFNRELAERQSVLMNLPDDLMEEYYSVLNVSGNGILGYISVPSADIMLPFYHGTREAVLQEGAGHIEGSSFPIDGESVHAVISGHRGLPSSLLFTNLDKVKRGDSFVIYILDEAFVYKVYSIETVKPTEMQSLHIEDGKNICTLVTCTPYGINSHRMLVHGELMQAEEAEQELAILSGASEIPFYYVVLILEIPVAILSLILSLRKVRKMR